MTLVPLATVPSVTLAYLANVPCVTLVSLATVPCVTLVFTATTTTTTALSTLLAFIKHYQLKQTHRMTITKKLMWAASESKENFAEFNW